MLGEQHSGDQHAEAHRKVAPRSGTIFGGG
jgi:hypothetical protein